MMPVRQKNEKKPPRKSPNIFGVSTPLSQPWRRNGTPTEPEQTTGAIPAGTTPTQGNHGLKSPRRLGAAKMSAVRW
jgi:hypothetical protein